MSHTAAGSPASGWAAGRGSGDGWRLLETITINQKMALKLFLMKCATALQKVTQIKHVHMYKHL